MITVHEIRSDDRTMFNAPRLPLSEAPDTVRKKLTGITNDTDFKGASFIEGAVPTISRFFFAPIFPRKNIALTKSALSHSIIGIPQLQGLIAKEGRLKLPETAKDAKWQFINALRRHVPLIDESVCSALEPTSVLFHDLIGSLHENLNGKTAINLISGEGTHSILLARHGATVKSYALFREALQNTELTCSFESAEVQERIDLSQLDNIEDLSGDKVDYLFYDNGIIKVSIDEPFEIRSFTGKNHEIPRAAIQALPRLLKPKGEAYFLTCKKDPPHESGLHVPDELELWGVGDLISEVATLGVGWNVTPAYINGQLMLTTGISQRKDIEISAMKITAPST